MFSYFATLVTSADDVATFTQPQHVRTSALEWNPSTRTVEIVHSGAPLPDVDINIALQASPYFSKLGALLKRNAQCIKVVAAWHDVSQPPIAYNVLIHADIFNEQMSAHGAIAGERHLQHVLEEAFRDGCLLLKNMEKTTTPHADWEQAYKWMAARDQAGATHIAYPHYLDVQGTRYVFCLNELTFVPRTSAVSRNIDLRGGLMLGARNAGKTRMVKKLITDGAVYSAGEQCPSFMRAVNATLLVVPPHLMTQWRAVLEPELSTLVVSEGKMHCTLDAVTQADVVITTPRVLHRARALDKHLLRKLRFCRDAGCSKRVSLASVFWHRVVVDEISACTDEVVHALTGTDSNPSLRCRMWWGLQGGVSIDSLAMNALAHVLLAPSKRRKSAMLHHIPSLARYTLCDVPPLLHLTPVWLESVHMVTLHPHEKAAYAALHSAQGSTLDLMYACAGSFKPLEVEYMCVVEDVLDAIPLGLEAIENTFITYDDEDDDSDLDDDDEQQEEEAEQEQGDQEEEEAAPPGEHQAEQQQHGRDCDDDEEDEDGAAADEEEEGDEEVEWESEQAAQEEGERPSVQAPPRSESSESEAETALELRGTTSRGLTFVVRTVGLAAFIESKTKMIEERKAFFRKTALALASGEQRMATCPICLCEDATCLLVCGHMMCQTCVIRLVDVARKNAEDDEDASDADVLCPTCRCELYKDCIFWITGPRPRLYSKAAKLLSLLKQFGAAHQNAVIIAESLFLLQNTIMPHMQTHGVSCMLVSNSLQCKQRAPHKLNEWLAAPRGGRAVFVELRTLRGMKLNHVQHVVLFHPLMPASKTVFENDILQSFMYNVECSVLTVHTLAAAETVEAACV